MAVTPVSTADVRCFLGQLPEILPQPCLIRSVSEIDKHAAGVRGVRHVATVIVTVVSSEGRMQGGGEGAVSTMPAPSYIPLGDPAKALGHRAPYRPHRQANPGSNYYSKTKRKRDSSSCSGRSESPPKTGETIPAPPPWHNPTCPYSRGIIG